MYICSKIDVVYTMKRVLFSLLLAIVSFSSLPLQAQETKAKSAVEEAKTPEINVVNNVLYVKNAPIGSRLEIVSIVGSKLKEIEMKSSSATYDLSNLPKAIYIFKLEGVVRKFVIR